MDVLQIRGIILFICAFLNFLLALFLLLRGKNQKDIFWLSITIFCSGLYAFFAGGVYFFWKEAAFSSILWYRLTWAGVLILPSFVIFTYYFTRHLKWLKLKIAFFYLTAAIIAYLAFITDLFVDAVHLRYPNISGIPGPLDSVGRFFIGFCIIVGLGNLLKEYFRSSGYKKLQTRYFIIGIVIYAIVGTIVTSIIPIFIGESPYYDIAAYFSLLWIGLTAYAMVRYRLMDVRVVLGKGAVYVFSTTTILALAFLLAFFNNRFLGNISFNIAGPVILIICILFSQFVFRFFEKFASKYFYYTFYSTQTVLADLGKRLTRVLDLDTLSSLITGTLINTMKLDRIAILIKQGETENYEIRKNVGFNAENGISLVKDNFLTSYLEYTRAPLVYDEIFFIARDIRDQKEKEKLEKIIESMKKIEASLCLPLFSENKIFGMLVLGNKVSKDPYSSQDIDLLESLGSQASITLQNAKLYSEIRGFNIKLESEVEKRTKELQAAYDELQKLDKAKSEFLSIASHQLRTPLTAIKGYISMILENTFGQPTEKMQRPLENIYTSNERLIKLVNDLLNISRIEAGRLEMKPEVTDLAEMINSIFEELKPTTQMRKITLKLEKPPNQSKHGTGQAEKSLPKIVIDADKIRQVLMNIVDNAIRYTKKGGITIKTSLHKNAYQIKITDTGEGMTKEDIGDLFDSFSRGRAGNKLWTEGMGLGLYVAKKFVDLHKGKIWAESKGKGKGSTFFVELPIE